MADRAATDVWEGYPIMTRKEEAKLMGVGAQYVSRIRKNAINTLKHILIR